MLLDEFLDYNPMVSLYFVLLCKLLNIIFKALQDPFSNYDSSFGCYHFCFCVLNSGQNKLISLLGTDEVHSCLLGPDYTLLSWYTLLFI